jgi:hypothetical protein
MPKFNVLVAHDVPNYGTVEIEARDPDHALEVLKEKDLSDILDKAVFDPAWDSSICARIVYMRDQQDNIFHEDTALDLSYREWSAVGDLVEALRKAESFIAGFEDDECQEGINELLGPIRAAIAKATGAAA